MANNIDLSVTITYLKCLLNGTISGEDRVRCEKLLADLDSIKGEVSYFIEPCQKG